MAASHGIGRVPDDTTSPAPPPVTPPAGDGRTALHGMARGGSFAAVGSAAGAALGLLLTLVVTHGLSQNDAGQFFSATAVFLVLQTLLAFGVGAGLVRFVPRFRALERVDDLPTLLRVALGPVVVSGALGSVAIWWAAPALAGRISDGDAGPLIGTFHLVAALFLPATLEIAAVECTRAFGSIRKYVLLQQLGVPLLRPVLVGVAALLDLPLWAVVLMWLIPLLIALVVAAVVVLRYLHAVVGPDWRHRRPSRPARDIAREYWAFTAARGIAMVMDSLLTWLDVVLVASLVSPGQAAIYAAASRFITAGTLVLQALRLTLATDISAALARGDLRRVSEMYRVATQWVVLSSWPLYLVMALFAPTVLHIFGSSYAGGGTATSILCLAMMLNLAAGNVGTVLLMGGKSGWVLADKTACVAVNIGLDLLLIPDHGITGAAIGWAVTIFIDSALSFSQVRWGMGVTGSLRGVALAAALALGCFGGAGLALRWALGDSVGVLLLCVAVGLAVYVAPLAVWRRELGLDVLVAAFGRRRPAERGAAAPQRKVP
jgi:O-antigen/teichoic acid export membrane protein